MAIPSPQAFSPGSATLIFLPCHGPTVREVFAKGAAIALENGVTAAVRPARRSHILFNGKPMSLAPVQAVLDHLAPEAVEVHLETPLPLGCGFGVSAGCSLTTAFAIARRYGIEIPREELGMIAHRAEVESGTGIGDVATQLSGGIVYRRGETGPFDCVKICPQTDPLHYRVFGPISTKEILADPKFQQTLEREGTAGIEWLQEYHETINLSQLLDRSLQFAERTELLTHEPVRREVDHCRDNGGHATMVMLGQSVIATAPGESEDWQSCSVDELGTRWLN